MLAAWLRHKFPKPLERLIATFDGAVFLNHKLASFGRIENHPDRDLCLVVLSIKRPRRPEIRSGPALFASAMREYDALVFYDFKKNALAGVVCAVGTMHHVSPGAARPDIHFVDGRRKTS